MPETETRYCVQCGNELTRRSNETARVFAARHLCSYACVNLHKRRIITVTKRCAYCSTELIRKDYESPRDFLQRTFCNQTCSSRYKADKKRNPKICCVYEIRNTINGRIYIGASTDVYQRWHKHRKLLRGGKHNGTVLQADWNEYGEQAFVFNILEVVDASDDLISKEQEWYDRTKCTDRERGYNTDPRAGTRRDARATEETRRRIATVTRGRSVCPGQHKRRLTEVTVLAIKQHLAKGETCTSISRIFSTSPSTVMRIRSGQCWSHVPWPD